MGNQFLGDPPIGAFRIPLLRRGRYLIPALSTLLGVNPPKVFVAEEGAQTAEKIFLDTRTGKLQDTDSFESRKIPSRSSNAGVD